jgi:hypothetical protein
MIDEFRCASNDAFPAFAAAPSPMLKMGTMNNAPEQPEDFVSLYRQAFAEYGTQALWNMRPVDTPTHADALAITKALRTHGGMKGRRLAERIEQLCLAPH